MRWLFLTGLLLAAMSLLACGGGDNDATGSAEPSSLRQMSKAEIAKLKEPKATLPKGPPPKKLVVRDLKKGTGATAKLSDGVVVNYVAISYTTGKIYEDTWTGPRPRPSRFPLEEVIRGWKEGLPGMKVGGRRELLVPSKLAYGQGALLYVIDLLGIEGNR